MRTEAGEEVTEITRSQEFERLVEIVVIHIGQNVHRLSANLLVCAQDHDEEPKEAADPFK